MQAGRRCGNRPAFVRVHRLVPLVIVGPIVAPDVRRQRNMADAIDRRLERQPVTPQPHRPPAKVPPLSHFAMNARDGTAPRGWFVPLLLEQHARTRLELLPRVHQGFPFFEIPNSQRRRWPSSQIAAATNSVESW